MILKDPGIAYWESVFTENIIAGEKLILPYEGYVTKNYTDMEDIVFGSMGASYTLWGTEGSLSYTQAVTALTPEEYDAYIARIDFYIKTIEDYNLGDYTKDYLVQLNLLRQKVSITRIEKIVTDWIQGIEVVTCETHSTIRQPLNQQYSYQYYQGAYDIQTGTGVGYNLPLPQEEYLEGLFNKPTHSDEKPIATRIWDSAKNIEAELRLVISNNTLVNAKYSKLFTDIDKKIRQARNEQIRIIRTEGNRFANQAIVDAGNASGYIDQYKHISTLDEDTSDICLARNGSIINSKDLEVGVTQPPLQPYCRSYLVPYISKGNVSGNNYFPTPEGITYEDWVQIVSQI